MAQYEHLPIDNPLTFVKKENKKMNGAIYLFQPNDA